MTDKLTSKRPVLPHFTIMPRQQFMSSAMIAFLSSFMHTPGRHRRSLRPIQLDKQQRKAKQLRKVRNRMAAASRRRNS